MIKRGSPKINLAKIQSDYPENLTTVMESLHPGITRSDLLIINKTDLAPIVGASLEVMDRDAKMMRKERPFIFSNLKAGEGLQDIIDFIIAEGMLGEGKNPPAQAGVQ